MLNLQIKVLYVRNLKADVTEDLLRSTFEVYGAVEKVKKIKDYGFVHFVEREGAIKALEALNETVLTILYSLSMPSKFQASNLQNLNAYPHTNQIALCGYVLFEVANRLI